MGHDALRPLLSSDDLLHDSCREHLQVFESAGQSSLLGANDIGTLCQVLLVAETHGLDALVVNSILRKERGRGGGGEGAPIHVLMVRLETAENHQMFCLMP